MVAQSSPRNAFSWENNLDANHSAESSDTTELVQAAASGDRQAFGVLVTRHAGSVTGVAYSACGDFARSEDVGQDAFVEAWRNLASLREPDKFVAWVCTIARRRAIDVVRAAKASRTITSIESIPSELTDAKQLSPEASMSQDQQRQLVWSMLESLPEAYREPMVLFYRSEQSTRDVAIALGENESTIRQRLKRGREMLRAEVTESLRKTLCETAPKAAFAAVVIASLPSASYAAAATTATTVAGKSAGIGSVPTKLLSGAAYGLGGAAFGTMAGLLGGAFGTWMGWKNCEYESQQKFILREAMIYVAAFVVFLVLLAILIYFRLHGFIDNGNMYGGLLCTLIVGFQVFNGVWMCRSIRTYNSLGEQARANGEPMREPVRQKMEEVKQLTQVVRPDGSSGHEAFRWNAGAWFGSSLGSICWILPMSMIAFRHDSTATGLITLACFLAGVVFTFAMWQARSRITAFESIQLLLAFTFVLTVIVLAAEQFLANPATQNASSWTPWGWLILLLFPALSFRFHWIRQSFEKSMQSTSADPTRSAEHD